MVGDSLELYRNTNKIYQGVGNKLLCVSVLNRSGEATKKNVFLPLLLATNWISWHVKSIPGTSNANCRKPSIFSIPLSFQK